MKKLVSIITILILGILLISCKKEKLNLFEQKWQEEASMIEISDYEIRAVEKVFKELLTEHYTSYDFKQDFTVSYKKFYKVEEYSNSKIKNFDRVLYYFSDRQHYYDYDQNIMWNIHSTSNSEENSFRDQYYEYVNDEEFYSIPEKREYIAGIEDVVWHYKVKEKTISHTAFPTMEYYFEKFAFAQAIEQLIKYSATYTTGSYNVYINDGVYTVLLEDYPKVYKKEISIKKEWQYYFTKEGIEIKAIHSEKRIDEEFTYNQTTYYHFIVVLQPVTFEVPNFEGYRVI